MVTTSKVIQLEKDPLIDWDLRLLDNPTSKHTPETKIAVMTHYFVTGSLLKASTACGVEYTLVRDWHTRSAWWESEYNKIVMAKQAELDSHFTDILHTCMNSLKDRVVNGDSVLDKNNEIVQLPMKGKDLAVVGAIVFDKRQLLRGNATRISGSTATLNDLEEKFKQFSDKLTKKD